MSSRRPAESARSAGAGKAQANAEARAWSIFYHDPQMPLFLMLVYAKAQREDMTPDQKKQVRALAASLKQDYRRKGKMT